MTAQPVRNQSQWTTQKLLQWMTRFFEQKNIDSPRLSAEMLLAHILGTERLKLYMDPHRPASELERATLRELVERAARHEPVEYLVGQCPFFAMMLNVSQDVLIPRPSTETLVEHVIQHNRRTPGFNRPAIADIGTGSGAVAVVLAKQIPGAHIIATDISSEAIRTAEINARRHHVTENIEFRQGDMLEPLTGERFHYLTSNPPYISETEWQNVAPNIRNYEPHHALRAGDDGLQYIRLLIERAHQYLNTPGRLVIEIAASQKEQVLELANRPSTHLHNIRILADHERLPRILVADRKQ